MLDFADELRASIAELERRIVADQCERGITDEEAQLSWLAPHWISLEPYNLVEDMDIKLTYTTPSGRIAFEVEVQTGKAAFEVVAGIQDLFEEPDCGACKSKNIKHQVREHEEMKYYNLVCSDCGAQIDFGQRKDGKGMWIKRTDKDGHPIPDRGWYHWKKKVEDTPKEEKPPYQGGADVPF